MTLETLPELIKMIWQFGGIPLAMYWIYTLRQDVKGLRKELKGTQDNHLNDVKLHGDTYAGLLEKTNNRLNRLEESIIKSLDEIKSYLRDFLTK